MKRDYQIKAAAGSHPGDRAQQQDQLALWTHPYANGCVMGVVADGMGGATGGRLAADQVLLTARHLFDSYDPRTDNGQAMLRQLALQAHDLIRLSAVASEQSPHSTLAAFVLDPGGKCYCVHSGDTRIYKYRGDRLVHQSKDHSYVQTLVDGGAISAEQARVHPQSNVLTACLGSEEPPQLDVRQLQRMALGDALLLCTDGLWHYFTEQELGRVVHALPPADASRFLIKKARDRARGGGDNLSVLVLKLLPAAAMAVPSA